MSDTMTLRQLADYLQMSADSVYHLVRRGKIPGVKIGKQWRFSKAAIDRWLARSGTRRVRVLVVGSDPAVSDALLSALHSKGHDAAGVATAAEAASLMGQVKFDVLILGLEALSPEIATLQQTLATVEPPEVLVVMGQRDSAKMLSGLMLPVPYLTVLHKPVDLDIVIDLVSRRTRS